ncbi:OPT superfamily [Sorochytrium milnesiophthora]
MSLTATTRRRVAPSSVIDNKKNADEEKGSPQEPENNNAEKGFVADEEFQKTIEALLPKTDNTDAPSLTFRVWLLGTVFCAMLSYINQILGFRTNPFSITAYLATLLGYPLGQLLARTLPTRKFNVPLLGECSLNPGPFCVKETVLIYIMGSTGTTGVYGTDNLFVQKFHYGVDIKHAASLGFLLATTLSGFGIAGLCSRFLVRPAHMIWPSALPQVALFRSFHAADESGKDPDVGKDGYRHMSRILFFGIATFGIVLYQLLPGWLAPALSAIGLVCFFTKNPVAQVIGSPTNGVGAFSLSFDWSIVSSGGSTLSAPFWVQVNVLIASIAFQWILVPLSWRQRWFGGPPLQLVLNDSHLVNRTGLRIDAKDLVDPKTNRLMEDVYEANAPFYASPFMIWAYFGSFASFAAAITHTAAWYGDDIVRRLRAARQSSDKNDIHCQMIDKYPVVPRAWNYFFFVMPTLLGVVVCHSSGIEMAWYHSLLSLLVAIVGTVSISVVLATSGIKMYMNVISEFVIGLAYPGHPIVMMAFKCFSVSVSQGVLILLQDLKIGHYMKVPPRHIFIAQVYSQILAVVVSYAALVSWCRDERHIAWILHADDYKNDPVGSKWSSAWNMTVYFNASLLWGALGPRRFFFTSYAPVVIAGFLMGGLLPIVCKLGYLYANMGIPWKHIYGPVLFTAGGPGSVKSAVLTRFLIATVFQFYLYRYRTKWWQRYNYVLATALDVGTALCTLITVYFSDIFHLMSPTWALDMNAGDFCPLADTMANVEAAVAPS